MVRLTPGPRESRLNILYIFMNYNVRHGWFIPCWGSLSEHLLPKLEAKLISSHNNVQCQGIFCFLKFKYCPKMTLIWLKNDPSFVKLDKGLDSNVKYYFRKMRNIWRNGQRIMKQLEKVERKGEIDRLRFECLTGDVCWFIFIVKIILIIIE